MKETHKIYIFSVLSHGAVAAVAHLIIYLVGLAWPEFGPLASNSSRLVDSFLTHCGVGLVVIPFFNPYEPSYRYFFRADRGKKQEDFSKIMRPSAVISITAFVCLAWILAVLFLIFR